MRTRKLKTRSGEMAAYYAGPSVYYAMFVQYGTRRGIRPNQFVQATTRALEPQIDSYIANKIADLK